MKVCLAAWVKNKLTPKSAVRVVVCRELLLQTRSSYPGREKHQLVCSASPTQHHLYVLRTRSETFKESPSQQRIESTFMCMLTNRFSI